MRAAALTAPSPTTKLAVFRDEDGDLIILPVDYFILFDGGSPHEAGVQGFIIGAGLCPDIENFVGYAPSEDEARKTFGKR
jgi:hypothetical protein